MSTYKAPLADIRFALFDVIGTNLWTGRHPFYAIVETATGQKFRTQTHWIRLQ